MSLPQEQLTPNTSPWHRSLPYGTDHPLAWKPAAESRPCFRCSFCWKNFEPNAWSKHTLPRFWKKTTNVCYLYIHLLVSFFSFWWALGRGPSSCFCPQFWGQKATEVSCSWWGSALLPAWRSEGAEAGGRCGAGTPAAPASSAPGSALAAGCGQGACALERLRGGASGAKCCRSRCCNIWFAFYTIAIWKTFLKTRCRVELKCSFSNSWGISRVVIPVNVNIVL